MTTAVGIRNCCRKPLASGMENIQSNSSKSRSRAGLVAVVPPRIQPAFEVTSRSTEPGSRPCPQLSSNADRHRFISISAYNHIMAASFTAQCGSARCGAFSSSKQRAPAAAVRAPTRSRQLVTRVQAAQKPPKQQMLVSRTSTPASLHHSSCCNINIACCRGHFTADWEASQRSNSYTSLLLLSKSNRISVLIASRMHAGVCPSPSVGQALASCCQECWHTQPHLPQRNR